MGKAFGIFSVVAGAICTLGSILHFTDYATKQKGYEVDLLRGSSALVQKYEGSSPKEPLAYLQRTIETVKQNTVFQESVGELEKEVQEVSTQIGESNNPMIYKPVLKNIGDNIDAILKEKAADSGDVTWGIGLASLALINFGLGINNFVKRDN